MKSAILEIEPRTIVDVRIVSACESDTPLIRELLRGLAEYQKMPDAVTATDADLRAMLFGDRPAAEVLLAYCGSQCAGLAIFFPTFCSMLARPGIYLDDLFVKEEWRGKGVGRALLSHLASVAADRNCGRLEWVVLDWNKPAINFYEGLGATLMREWTKCRLTDTTIRRLAHKAGGPNRDS